MNEFKDLNSAWILDNHGQAFNDYIRMLEQKVNPNLTFYGFARSEFKPWQPNWRIVREYNQGGVIVRECAGTGQFDQIWANRASLFSSSWANNLSVFTDGINDRVDVTNVNILSSLSTKYTISAWVKLGDISAPTTQNLFSITSSTVANRALIRLFFNSATSKFSFSVVDNAGTSAQANSSLSVSSFTWYHVVGVRDGANISIYVNGVLAGTASAALSAITVDSINMAARNNGGAFTDFLTTNLDEVTLWSKNFSQSQVSELYNYGSPTNPKDHSLYSDVATNSFLLAYWPMGDGDTYPTLLDQINANNGTIVNGTSASIQSLSPATDNTFSPSYIDGGSIAAGGSRTETYPAVPAGEIHQVDNLFIESTANYKVELKVDGAIRLTIVGAPRVSSPPRPITDIKLTAGQVLSIVKYNQNTVGSASVYSTLTRTKVTA